MLVVSRTTTTNTMANSCHNVFCFDSLAHTVTQAVCQDAQASESANLGKTCKYGIASASAAAAADATAAIIATDADDTVDVAASTDGLSLLKFNTCIKAL